MPWRMVLSSLLMLIGRYNALHVYQSLISLTVLFVLSMQARCSTCRLKAVLRCLSVWCNNSRLLNRYWVPNFTLFRGCVCTLWSALLLVWYCLVSKNIILPSSFITSYLTLPIPVGRVLIKGRSIPLSSGPANVDTSGNLFARRKSSCNIEMKRG